MKTFKEYLEIDGNLAFDIAIFNRFSSIGDAVYSSICGGFIEGVYQWSTHNISNVIEVKNNKYTGWIITFNNDIEKKVYIENKILNIVPKNWAHAKNIFNKYLKINS